MIWDWKSETDEREHASGTDGEEIYDPGAGEKLKFVKKYTDKFRKSIHMTHKTLYLMELIALYEEI